MNFFNPFIFQFFQQEPEIKSGQCQFFHHLLIWSITKPTFDGYVIPDQGVLTQLPIWSNSAQELCFKHILFWKSKSLLIFLIFFSSSLDDSCLFPDLHPHSKLMQLNMWYYIQEYNIIIHFNWFSLSPWFFL